KMKTEGTICLLCVLLIVFVFATGVLDQEQTWARMQQQKLEMRDGKTAFSTEAGDEYGVLNAGPYLSLAAGEYRLKWDIMADGDNEIVLSAGNGVTVDPAVIPITAQEEMGEATFTLEAAVSNFEIQIRFLSGTRIELVDVRLYTPVFTDRAWLFAFLLLSLLALWLLARHGLLTPERRGRLALLGLAVLVVSGPALKSEIVVGHDTAFHLARICNLADALASGQFPARMGGFSYDGYGALTSVFYPDLLLYPAALLLLGGASLTLAYNALIVAVNALTATTMYVCARRIFGDRNVAVASSILYTCAIYRLTDVYTRCAVGEMCALSVMPLFLLGLYEVVLGDRTRWRVLVLGAAAVYLNHLLSVLMCAVLALGVCLVFARRIIREKRVPALLKAAGMTALVCAFHLLPLLMYSAQGIGASSILNRTAAESALQPAQLLMMTQWDSENLPSSRYLVGYGVELGLPLLLGTALCVYAAVSRSRAEWDKQTGEALMLAGGGAALALMTTTLFPWPHLSLLTGGLSDCIQFPWRLLGPAALLLSLCGGFGFMRLAGGNAERINAALLALSLVCVMPMLTTQTHGAYIDYGETASPHLTYAEYNIPGTIVYLSRDQKVYAEGDVTLEDYVKDGTSITARVETDEAGALALPLFGFDGYRAEVDGERMETGLGENNRLTVLLPEGTSGTLRVWFEGKAIWRVGDAVSALAAAALILGAIRPKRRTARRGTR
ncbi:MAG: hypothetical protein Q4G52_07300, partial [Clostridia bacterium]|nr:hypothetical protein [Clostridia bacterium]